MRQQRVWMGGLLSLALLSTACDVKVGDEGLSLGIASGQATDEWMRTYEISPGGRLQIDNVNGEIVVSPATGTQVEVRAVREARAGSEEASRALLKQAEMREDVAPDRVSIQPPQQASGDGGFGRPRLTITYDVRLPPGLSVQFKTQNGQVRLENIQGDRITASTTNGGVIGRGLSGAVEATTVNGGIQMDFEEVTGDTRLVTVNGGIVLTLASGIDAELDATVVNGAVTTQDGFPLTVDDRRRQRVAGRINDGGPRIVVQTTNGGVRLGYRKAPES